MRHFVACLITLVIINACHPKVMRLTCESLTHSQSDLLTGKIEKANSEPFFFEGEGTFNLFTDSAKIKFLLVTGDGCNDKTDRIYVTFSDGETKWFNNTLEGCDGYWLFSISNKEENNLLTYFATTRIRTVTVNDKKFQVGLSDAEAIAKTVECLRTYIK